MNQRVIPSNGSLRNSQQAREALRQLEWTPTRRYVELLREEGLLLKEGDLDVDVGQLVDRRFLCDSIKCLKHKGKRRIDTSCCARYRIELTSLDRERLLEILPLIRNRFPLGHPLRDESVVPWVLDEDYRRVMADDDRGVCPFVVYEGNRSLCFIHDTCLRHGLNPWEYKPIACSLWPIATIEYVVDREIRTLVTAYGPKTQWLFSDEEDYRKSPCLADDSPELPRLYDSHRGILERIFGRRLLKLLDDLAVTREKSEGNPLKGDAGDRLKRRRRARETVPIRVGA